MSLGFCCIFLDLEFLSENNILTKYIEYFYCSIEKDMNERVASTAQDADECPVEQLILNEAQQVYRPTTNQTKEDRGKSMRQIIAAFVVNLGTINTGLVFGFSAVVIPQLLKSNSLIHIDDSQKSWIGK